jgi:hypothetical protein
LFVTVVSVMRSIIANLTPTIGASGPHDFTVRFSRARQSLLWRPSLPDPRFVTNAHTPLVWDGMAQEVKLICLRDQARSLRHIGTTGNSAKCCQVIFADSMHAFSLLRLLREKCLRKAKMGLQRNDCRIETINHQRPSLRVLAKQSRATKAGMLRRYAPRIDDDDNSTRPTHRRDTPVGRISS